MDATEMVDGPEEVTTDTAETGGDEDRIFDTLEDAAEALADDDFTGETDEPEGEFEAEEEPEDPDLVEIDLDDGKITLKELKSGYLRQQDYTAKTTEVAEARKALDTQKAAAAERLSGIETAVQNLAGFAEKLIPPEPPLSLARTDPGKYAYEKAMREAAIAEITQLLTVKQQVEDIKNGVTQAELDQYRREQEDMLLKAMPSLRDPAKRADFNKGILDTAKAFGFSEDEINQTHDARIRQLVHYARIGQRAVQNQRNAAQRVAEAPKTAKARPAQTTSAVIEQKKAMHRFTKTGRMEDALKLDF